MNRSRHLLLRSRLVGTKSRSVATRAVGDSQYLRIDPRIQDAIRSGQPVVALESTILAHGMPYPQNVELSRRIAEILRSKGVEPATIAIKDGVCCVGLTSEEIVELSHAGEAGQAQKCTTRAISLLLARQLSNKPSKEQNYLHQWGATTVAATMRLAHMAGIATFVTGGVGGVHRHGEVTMDISADLTELSRTPVVVVSAGIKSILDIQRTLEVLETFGVPTIGYRTKEFPAFFSAQSGIVTPTRLDSPSEIAAAYRIAREMDLPHGFLVAVPNEDPAGANVEEAIQAALIMATDLGIHGPGLTPFVLSEVSKKTEGDSLRSNIALVERNAAVGADIAIAIADQYREFGTQNERNIIRPQELRGDSVPSKVPDNAQPKVSDTKENIQLPHARVVCLGGIVLDMVAKPINNSKLIMRTSNPAVCSESDGGVARNVAEVLSRLGATTLLYSAVGNDARGKVLRERLNGYIPASDKTITVVDGGRTATYLAILQEQGDLHTACAEMSVLDQIVSPPKEAFEHAEMLVIDANPPLKVLQQTAVLAKSLGVKVFLEPTSVAKARKVGQDSILMSNVTYASPNLDELLALADGWGTTLDDHDDLYYDAELTHIRPIAKQVLSRMSLDEANLLITCGEKGVVLASRKGAKGNVTFQKFPAEKVIDVKNATGAGDTLSGAFIHAILNGLTLREAVEVGIEAATMSLKYSEAAISPLLSTFRSRKHA